MHSFKFSIPAFAVIIASLYYVSDFFIGRMQTPRIDFPHENRSTAFLLSKLVGYAFDGKWRRESAAVGGGAPLFGDGEGPSRMHISVEKTNLFSAPYFVGARFAAERQYVFAFRFSSAADPSQGVYYVVSLREGELRPRMSFDKSVAASDNARGESHAHISVSIDDSRFRQSGALSDLRIALKWKSEGAESSDISVEYQYDAYRSTQQVLRFIAFSLLTAIFDFMLIWAANNQFKRFDYTCRSESVTFWTSLAMFNCLLCFVQIFYSTENSRYINYFFFNALLRFANFTFLILRVLHRIARTHIAAVSYEATVDETRRYILAFYLKVYIIILFGLLHGVRLLQGNVFLYIASCLFFVVVGNIANDNKRLFHSRALHLALTGSQLLSIAYIKSNSPLFARANSLILNAAIALYFLSAFLYKMQREGNPRLFLARFWGENAAFDYFAAKSDEGDGLCPICFAGFGEEVGFDGAEQLSDVCPSLYQFISRKGHQLMTTPCAHRFHTPCLVTYMKYKMNCPVCRSSLPEIA